MRPEWNEFVVGKWENEINVRDFMPSLVLRLSRFVS